MIGVVATAEQRDVACEFFELFKTAWDFYRADGQYEVILTTAGTAGIRPSRLVLIFGSHPTTVHRDDKTVTTLAYKGARVPIYGDCATFSSDDAPLQLVMEDTGESVVSVTYQDDSTIVRVGYDLFSEIRFLLTSGQPIAWAAIPTIERHIALLRDLILAAGIPVVEIPPVPAGHRFMACLTHDIDHPFIRLHTFDHTMFGFLYRATVGSLIRAFRGRLSLAALARNLGSAVLLPLVHLGWIKDFWSTFEEYLRIEQGRGSTFFVIPIKHQPGRTVDGEAPAKRASSYAVSDIAHHATAVVAAGGEIAVHGIDAWVDSASGAEERDHVSRAAGSEAGGVRMHWLFWDAKTPERLDKAGFSYDSSFGYNATVGFRAGTSQVFKPITAGYLLELPLTIMDTALFYPSYLDLTQDAARHAVHRLVDEVERHGGALTVNWHDRSLAPERLWGGFYNDLIAELTRRQAWFPTAAQATAWFRRRRSAMFQSVCWDRDSVRVTATVDELDHLPDLTLRVHTPRLANSDDAAPQQRFIDVPLRNRTDACVTFTRRA
jgi:hypothetical protein